MKSLLNDEGSRAVLSQDAEDDSTSDRVLSDRMVTARKDHPCHRACAAGFIQKGERYQRVAVLDPDGWLLCLKFCTRCNAWQARAKAMALAVGLLASVLAQRAEAQSHPPPPPPRPAIWTLPVFIQALPPDPARALCKRQLERRVLRRLTGPAAQRRMRVLLNGGRTRP